MRRPLRVVFAGMKWDYGFRERGLSFEHTNLYDAMRRLDAVDVHHFDFMESFREGGHEAVREGLCSALDHHRADVLFTVLFTDEVPQDLLAELRDRPGLTTFNWFCDDHWRFDAFTRTYAPLFNACSTTARSALPRYAEIGYDRVIKTQWGCNHYLYRPVMSAFRHDVTFVGQPHGDRRKVVERLRTSGVKLDVWGTGWEAGRLTQDEMIETFSASRINLNLSNASVAKSRWRRVLSRHRYDDQIKGRNFEIPGCGGFQLSGHAEDIETYYEPDSEIALFYTQAELVDKVQRYLADEPLRQAIASAGYRRTLAQHTYEHRFRDIFRQLGLQ